jgi:carboxylesterase type B
LILNSIYGGGFDAGGIADPRYNASYLVQEATNMGKPTIVVSINYRVGGWGFLAPKRTLEDEVANIGLFAHTTPGRIDSKIMDGCINAMPLFLGI